MARGIRLSTSPATTSTGKEGGAATAFANTSSSNYAPINDNGRKEGETEDGVRLRRSSTVDDIGRSPRSVRLAARSARKSIASDLAFPANSSSGTTPISASSPRRQACATSFLSPKSYSVLVTITIALLAWTFVQPVQAALSCTTNADCSGKGVGKCKPAGKSGGASTCVYKSCSTGYWGAGNTYSDCYACPTGTTSLEGKAFYVTDCFVPCGNSRCYTPEDGRAECAMEPASAKQMCFSKCNSEGFVVLHAEKPYATCVKMSKLVKSSNSTLTNQAQPASKRKVVKLLEKRSDGDGRRLKLKSNVDLHAQGPAVALLRNAGRDPLALVSK